MIILENRTLTLIKSCFGPDSTYVLDNFVTPKNKVELPTP